MYTDYTPPPKQPQQKGGITLGIRNQDLRKAKGSIPAWAIAEKMGVHENTIYRLFRSKLNEGKKEEILKAIKDSKKEYNN